MERDIAIVDESGFLGKIEKRLSKHPNYLFHNKSIRKYEHFMTFLI